jgi:hypothetical protein
MRRLLCRQCAERLTLPKLQGQLLNGAGKENVLALGSRDLNLASIAFNRDETYTAE